MDRSSVGPAPPNAVAEEQFRRGFEFAKSGDLDEAILNVEAALAVSPEESRYHDLLGTLYAKKGLYEMAVAEWRRSIECDPAHAEVFRRIDTAQKMRVQPDPRASQWNWMAIGLLGAGLVLAVAYATYQVRSTSAQSRRLAVLEEQAENIDRDYVLKSEFDTAQAQIQDLHKSRAIKDASITELSQKVQEFETSGKYIAKTELDKERETLNRVRSELAAERMERQRLEKERAAMDSGAGVETMAAELERKEKRIQSLTSEYESMNQERNRLEREQAETNLQLTRLRGQVETLEKQAVTLLSATEGERLRAENRSLLNQLASATVAGGTSVAPASRGADAAQFSLLLNETLGAVELVLEGDKDRAAAVLKSVQAKAPAGTDVDKTLKRLAPPIPQVVEAPKSPVPSPTSTPAPQPKPTERKVEPKPTATPKPRPTQAVAQVPTAIPRASGGTGATIPRPLPGQEGRLRTNPAPPQPKPSPPPAPKASGEEERLQRLQAEKKRFADQALNLYKQRNFEGARNAVNQGLRIDPKDPRLNQLRDAIEKAQRGG